MIEDLLSGDIYYRTNIHQEGKKNLLFIHGLTGSASAWTEYEKKFGDSYNIFSFDLRGHGKSYKPKNYLEYSIKLFAEDIDKLIKHLHIDKPIIICHSFATFVVLEYLKSHQEDVSGVVFLSPNFAPGKGIISKVLKPLLKAVRHTGLIKPANRRGEQIDYKLHPQSGDWDLVAGFQDIKNTSLGVYLYCLEQSLWVDYTSFLGEIRVPVMLVHGSRDGYFSVENSLYMHRTIPHSQIRIIEGADHIIVKNNFPEVSAFIKDFV